MGAWSKKIWISPKTPTLHNPTVPHVIVLEPGLVVKKTYNGYWFFGQPTMEYLRQDLGVVLKKCRPDRDIMTPEIKAARQQGRNVARKYLQKDKLAILVVGNDCEFDKPLSIVGAVTNVDITLPHRPRN